jgi:DNA modification methylase
MKINIEEIYIPDRQLEEDQQEIVKDLADSMKEIGLSHPILLRKCSPSEQLSLTQSKAKYVPIAGERRIRAAKLLGWLIIEAEIREVTEHDSKIIRLHENLRRYNLPWYEQVSLVEELHNLRQLTHGISDRGRPKEVKKGWSLRDTAAELNVGLGNLSEDIFLSRALREDPNLAKVKDRKTAMKLARITLSRAQTSLDSGAPQGALRASQGLEVDQVYLGDSVDILKQLPADSVDHCITDPPWIKFYDAKLRIDQRTLPVFKELYRVLKPGAMLYVFAGMDDIFYYSGYNLPGETGDTVHRPGKLEDLGYKVATTPVIWKKEKSLSRRGVRPWEYDKDFEFIVVACKGDATLTSPATLSGVKSFPIVPSPSLIHPNEKPLALIVDLLSDCSHENNVVIDPFAGSGVVGLACKKNNRRYILIERDKKFYDGIVARLKKK